MTSLHGQLERWADDAVEAAHALGGMAEVVSTFAGLPPRRPDTWTGTAALAYEALEGRVRADAEAVGVAARTAAGAFLELGRRLAEAVRLAREASLAGHDADDLTRAWHRRREAAVEATQPRSAVGPAPDGVGPDPGAALRRHAAALVDEARELAARAAAEFAARLDAATADIPTGERRTPTELASEFLGGVVDAARGVVETALDFSTIRMVLDPRGWWSDVAGAATGLAAAVEDPAAAARAMLDLDTWDENPARAAGRLAPDLLLGVATGGAGAAATRSGTAATRLGKVAKRADALDDVSGPPGMVRPRPDDPDLPIINLTAVGDRMGDNATNIRPLDGLTDVAIHGSPTGFGTTPHGPSLSPSLVADMISRNPKFDGGPIRLVSCRTGASTCGSASGLADELGVDVLAPTTTVWVYPDGRLVVGEGRFGSRGLEITEPGEWIRFPVGEE